MVWFRSNRMMSSGSTTNKQRIVGGLAIGVVACVGAAYLWRHRRASRQSSSVTAASATVNDVKVSSTVSVSNRSPSFGHWSSWPPLSLSVHVVLVSYRPHHQHYRAAV
jgi:hypothetical protein